MFAALFFLAARGNDDPYLRDSIKTWVWSGFYSRNEVVAMLQDIAEDQREVDRLTPFITSEFLRKKQTETTWPLVTDCDRLDAAFADLRKEGIIALQNAGMDISDGQSDVGEELAKTDRSKVRGYCFYHGQDLERAVAGKGLLLAFGDRDNVRAGKIRVGHIIVDTMRSHGFSVEWNGDPDNRILLPKIDWKRRHD